jgi:hypothetical protein
MTLTRFFYINSNKTKVFCYTKFCNYPKKTTAWQRLKKELLCYDILGVGYEYKATNGSPITYKKLK